MTVLILDTPRAFGDAKDRWTDLYARSPSSDLFLTHDWIDAWWHAFAEPDESMYIACVERDGRFLAALPLMRSPMRIDVRGGAHVARVAARRLRSIFNHYSGRGGMLFDPSAPSALEELFSAILAAHASWELVELEWVPEDSPLYAFLAGGAVPGLNVFAVRTNESPFLPMDAGGFDAWYAAQFSAKTRSRDRGSLRDAQVVSGFALDVLADPSTLDALMDLEMLGWKGEAKSAMKNDTRASRFVHDVCARLAGRGALVIVLLRLHDRPAAFVLGFVDRGCFYYFKTSFDPRHEELRPGRIVTTRAIQEAFARGLVRFDFLGAADEYKLRYTSETRPHAAVFLYHSGVRSQLHRMMKRHAVPLAKAILGRGPLYPVRVDH